MAAAATRGNGGDKNGNNGNSSSSGVAGGGGGADAAALAALRKAADEAASGGSRKPLERTRFRRPKSQSPAQRAAAAASGGDGTSATASLPKRSSPVSASAAGDVHVLVDGYNVINAWPRLKRLLRRGELRQAREELCVDLSAYAVFYGVRVTAVFDAAGGGDETRVNAREQGGVTYSGVDVVYPSTLRSDSADSWIERRAEELFEGGKRGKSAKGGDGDGDSSTRVVVVTNDSAVRDAVRGAGGTAWSTSQLKADIKAASEILEEQAREMPGVISQRYDPNAPGALARSPARQTATLQYGLDLKELFALEDESAKARAREAAKLKASKERRVKKLFEKKPDDASAMADGGGGMGEDGDTSSSSSDGEAADGGGPPRRKRKKFRFKS